MTKREALKLLDESQTELAQVQMALELNDLPKAKEHFTKALTLLDNTCAIQLDNLN